ncbi:hypothetical protein BSIN_2794 [Burkholderia singularis]|uniref:Uncharacterized protein n=1 Tax=Burkholderia singularis TaxID=1503053 RepID=A0A238H2V7_9BURK|nr:hypothetical protein BSIN_2794 [Burkholderia singularis]
MTVGGFSTPRHENGAHRPPLHARSSNARCASCAERLARASLHAVPATFAAMARRKFHFAVIGTPATMRATIARLLDPTHCQPGA